ncbi:MAG: hypothetical protein U1E04_04025 [Hylemonella sp.]|nr:hypothetical protein [Hylemonella sp.]
MNISTSLHPHALDRIGYSTTIPTSALAAGGAEERLPFTVRLVRNEQDLKKAVDIRHAAYARHMPSVAETLKEPEALDLDVAAAVLLAESKLDGSPIGTIRIQSNRFRPLALEQAIEVPDWLKGKTMAHVSRLGVAQGLSGRLVKTMLIKASFQYCENNGIDWAIVAARSPLDRQYAALMFEDIFPGAGYTPLPHMNNVPHRVMGFEIASGKSRWAAAQHPLLDFFCNTYHPDIDVFDDQGQLVSLSFDQSRTQQAVRVQ